MSLRPDRRRINRPKTVVARKRQTAQNQPIVSATATNAAISATGSKKQPNKAPFHQ